MASSSIVIKLISVYIPDFLQVKFGETLRRFTASINDKKLDLDVVALRAKIRSFFNFNPDVAFTLTYVDEDGDAVTLADDDDLHDVVRQSLNPLRLTVTLPKDNNTPTGPSGTSTPMRSVPPPPPPPPHHPSGPLSDFLKSMPEPLSNFLKSMPEPFRDQLTKLPLELASKASQSSTPGISELAEKLTAAYLNQMPNSMAVPRPSTEPESSSSKNKEKSVFVSEDVKSTDIEPPKRVDLKHPYFDYDSFPAPVEGYNGKPSVENKKDKNTTDGVVDNKIDSLSSADWTQGILNSTNQCPFSGMPMPLPNESYHHPSRGHGHHGHGHGHWKRYGHGNGMGSLVFHRGVRCDGCGVHPITGPRFKSKVKEDYDLCSDCFAGMGNVSDYIRMDRPTNVVRNHMGFRGFHDPSIRVPTPGLPQALRGHLGSRGPRCKLDSRFILDVNVLDGTTMAPLTVFTKIWKMRNNGSIVWPRGSQLHWIGGDRLSNHVSVDIEIPNDGLGVEKELDIAVEFSAPQLPGRYISYWRMASPSGQKFGQRVWVLIQVDASMKDLGQSQPPSINLNMPPVTNPEETSVTQDLNFPTNDTLIVGDADVATSVTASAPVFRPAEVETALGIFPTLGMGSSEGVGVAYPRVDFSEVPPVVGGPVVVERSGSGGEGQEQGLLEELVAMGFKQLDLNKEVLRANDYDLEKSVDDLCGVSEWDPILEELQEMGFVDEEANRRLLKKNNGSIKRVVMDLINGERA
ncbi:hypothetical protein LXL04_009495 [Taraxacum kok-saghyz]